MAVIYRNKSKQKQYAVIFPGEGKCKPYRFTNKEGKDSFPSSDIDEVVRVATIEGYKEHELLICESDKVGDSLRNWRNSTISVD